MPVLRGLRYHVGVVEIMRRQRRAVIPLSMLLASVLFPCAPAAYALDPALDVSQYAHKAWNTRDGFPEGRHPRHRPDAGRLSLARH